MALPRRTGPGIHILQTVATASTLVLILKVHENVTFHGPGIKFFQYIRGRKAIWTTVHLDYLFHDASNHLRTGKPDSTLQRTKGGRTIVDALGLWRSRQNDKPSALAAALFYDYDFYAHAVAKSTIKVWELKLDRITAKLSERRYYHPLSDWKDSENFGTRTTRAS